MRSLDTGLGQDLAYDKLVLATGAHPFKPAIPAIYVENVWQMHHPNDAESLLEQVLSKNSQRAVVIGSGLIGIEMVEALIQRGLDVTMVEMFDRIMPQVLDHEMAALAAKCICQKGCKLVLGEQVIGLEGSGKLSGVSTEQQTIAADLALVAVGVRPNDELARTAGLVCAEKGGIIINSCCQTSGPKIYAGGDCVVNSYVHPVTGSQVYVPLGSTANKQGRVIANHIAGLTAPFAGVSGSSICKALDFTLGRTGLTEKQARELRLDYETAIWAGLDTPHYIKNSKPLVIKMIASRRYRKLLGVQVVGMGDASKRLDVAASAIFFGATLEQIGNVDLGYAPPYSPPIDPLATTAHVLPNKLNGLANGISPLQAKQRMDNGDDLVLLDVRTPQEWEVMRLPHEKVVHLPLGELRSRLHDLPKDKDILTFCKVSTRGYEAQRILNGAGFTRVQFIEGGLLGWPFELWKASR